MNFPRHASGHGVEQTLYTNLGTGETFAIEHAIDPYHDGYKRVYEERDSVFYATWADVIAYSDTSPPRYRT